jgi:hypothetical protein
MLLAAPVSQASVLNITTGCCGAGPYGSVTLTQNGTQEIDASVVLLNPYLFISGGQAGAFAFNVDLAHANLAITVSPASVAAGFAAAVLGDGTFSEHMAGFGSFGYAIEGDASHTHGGSQPIGQVLTFIVVNNAGAISASDFQLDSTGGTKSFFAADIIDKATSGPGAGTTGIVGSSDQNGITPASVTPEPGTLLMLGVGLLAAGLLRRSRNPIGR